MNSPTKIRIGLGCLAISCAALGLWYSRQKSDSDQHDAATNDDVAATIAKQTNPFVVEPTPAATASSSEGVSADVLENRGEVAATAQMYAAHAPLRTPEVADPDSETNRRILQTMVEKALHGDGRLNEETLK